MDAAGTVDGASYHVIPSRPDTAPEGSTTQVSTDLRAMGSVLHGTCRRCSHFHNAMRIEMPGADEHRRYCCEKCNVLMFGLGGSSTQISLASKETTTSWKTGPASTASNDPRCSDTETDSVLHHDLGAYPQPVAALPRTPMPPIEEQRPRMRRARRLRLRLRELRERLVSKLKQIIPSGAGSSATAHPPTMSHPATTRNPSPLSNRPPSPSTDSLAKRQRLLDFRRQRTLLRRKRKTQPCICSPDCHCMQALSDVHSMRPELPFGQNQPSTGTLGSPSGTLPKPQNALENVGSHHDPPASPEQQPSTHESSIDLEEASRRAPKSQWSVESSPSPTGARGRTLGAPPTFSEVSQSMHRRSGYRAVAAYDAVQQASATNGGSPRGADASRQHLADARGGSSAAANVDDNIAPSLVSSADLGSSRDQRPVEGDLERVVNGHETGSEHSAASPEGLEEEQADGEITPTGPASRDASATRDAR